MYICNYVLREMSKGQVPIDDFYCLLIRLLMLLLLWFSVVLA
jgi:hypothetical protein